MWIKDLRGIRLIDGGVISEKLNKIRVKFLKFSFVERLWNTGNQIDLLESVLKKFSPGKSVALSASTVALRQPVGGADKRSE